MKLAVTFRQVGQIYLSVYQYHTQHFEVVSEPEKVIEKVF